MLQGSEAAAKFIDTIIDAKLNGTELDSDVRATLHSDLLQSLEHQIIRDIIDLLNEQQQLELEHLIDSKQIDKIEQYLIDQGIDINRVLAGTMSDFQAAYIGA